MLKIGLLGAGHLGKIHLKCIQLLPATYELVGFYDPNDAVKAQVAKQFGIKPFPSAEALIHAVDVVDIVTPTTTHSALATMVMKANKHLFIEKPITHTLEEAKALMKLHESHPVKIQIGHVERFNPALLALADFNLHPMFIEGHRLATFNPRGTDVPVVLDLMIHDLDIVLSMVKAPVKHIHASGVAVVSDSPDIANARIAFENGCIANLTASRISLKQMRKIRLFQKEAYISLDFLDKQAQIVRLYDQELIENGSVDLGADAAFMEIDTPKGKKVIHMSIPEIEPVNAIKMELATLAESIVNHTPTKVSIGDGYQALELAEQIMEEIRKSPSSI